MSYKYRRYPIARSTNKVIYRLITRNLKPCSAGLFHLRYENMDKIRIGIDFGYKYTGVSVLNSDNKILDYKVITHRTDISKTLLNRRTNRSSRRRKHTQNVRLRNFYALLKGMGIEPQQQNHNFIGSKLYAMAHRRGWDYSSLIELLIDDKKGITSTVRAIDKLLIDEFNAPHTIEEKNRKGNKYTVKKINTTCLGGLAQYQKQIKDNQGIIDKNKVTEQDKSLADKNKQEAELEYEKLHYKLDNAGLDEIKEYIETRLKVVGIEQKTAEALDYILVLLGLNIGEKLHKDGKLYTPHKNRHRNELIKDLKENMKVAFKEKEAIQIAEQFASKQNTTVELIQEEWLKNVVAILDPNNPQRGNNSTNRKKNNKDIRPSRFENRHTGKCPAKLENGSRCNCNLPKKSRVDIRALQFEIEAKQMNIKTDDSTKKLTDDELTALINCADFEKVILVNNGEDWNTFFDQHKTPKVKSDARGKKDILKDIAIGSQAGRSGLCKIHLQEKLTLLNREETQGKDWGRLHQERLLSIYSNDAPPSIRQKIEVVISTLKQMLKQQKYDIKNLPIEHIGIETARFDISALAQNEGKRLKNKKDYQTKANISIQDIKDEQGGKCIYCGNDLGFATTEHIFAKSLGGSNKALNKAAAHSICNINKGNQTTFQIAQNVLDALKENNLKKYNFIQKGIKNNWHKTDTSLAGAQHTMFGAKLLKGSLIDAFALEQLSETEIQQIFPKVKPRETAFLRKQWFPLIDRQKSAIRYKKKDNIKAMEIVINEMHPKPFVINWSKKFDDLIIKLDKPEKLKSWIKHQTKNKETTITIDENHQFKQGDEGVLSYQFNAIDKTTGEIKQYQKIHIVIKPAKNDGVHEFHHAIDAIVSAVNIDWSALNSVNTELTPNDKDYWRKFNKAVGNVCPNIRLKTIKINGKNDFIAPNKNLFLKENKQDQSRVKCSKTDTQALRLKNDKITQRKMLYTIKESGVRKIQSNSIKSLMIKAFDSIEEMPDDKKKIYLSKDKMITQDYFLTLKPNHKLHPTNTRSVRCLVGGTGPKQMFKIINKHNQGEHFYKATKKWGYVVVYKQNKEIISERFLDQFYVNKNNPQILEPDNAVEIKRFKSGDKVTSIKQKGLWRISELGESAVLVPLDITAQDIKDQIPNKVMTSYKNLELQTRH